MTEEIRFLNDGGIILKNEEGIFYHKSNAESLPLTVDREEGERLFEAGNEIYVFQVCECDAVAASSLKEALAWYKDLTGLEDDELYEYDGVELIEHAHKVNKAEEDKGLITVREILEKHWKGEPFIAVTTGGY
ncbi:hypothetical protein [Solibacillus sp. FSL W8-0372]|uniref:hypothetical protein n=1 Tax=Solibacillus sp. FSL W8-0372 TaxID=2921713 RepID=UPI0030D4DA0A